MFIFIKKFFLIFFDHTVWLQDPSSATQDWTCAPCSGSTES